MLIYMLHLIILYGYMVINIESQQISSTLKLSKLDGVFLLAITDVTCAATLCMLLQLLLCLPCYIENCSSLEFSAVQSTMKILQFYYIKKTSITYCNNTCYGIKTYLKFSLISLSLSISVFAFVCVFVIEYAYRILRCMYRWAYMYMYTVVQRYF